MKRTFGAAGLALVLLVTAFSASAQVWRGMGRLHGVVLDEQGKPIKDAKVVLRSVRGSNTGPDAILTDAKGKWAGGGLIGGEWLVDIMADGFITAQKTANVSELARLVPAMKVQLQRKPEEKPKPVVEEREAIMIGGVEVSPETAASITAANAFMKEEKWKEAAAEYEKALAVLTTSTQLKFALARAYYGGGELKKAISQLRDVYQADTGNVMAATLLADMLLEDGQLDEANTVLAAIPEGAITDANTMINLGIRFVNNSKPAEAHKYFHQAVGLDPALPAAYYYRALASVQLKKMDAAKADLEKVIELAPDSTEAKDAKEILVQIK